MSSPRLSFSLITQLHWIVNSIYNYYLTSLFIKYPIIKLKIITIPKPIMAEIKSYLYVAIPIPIINIMIYGIFFLLLKYFFINYFYNVCQRTYKRTLVCLFLNVARKTYLLSYH